MPTTQSRRDERRPATTGRGWLLAAVTLALVLAGLGLRLARRQDPAAELIARQQALATAAAPLRPADVDAIIRAADRLTATEIRAVRISVASDWLRLEQESVDRYFAATPPERPALLDDDIARLRKYHALLAALNPHDAPGMPVRMPRQPKQDRDDTPAEAQRARRELVRLYQAARSARAAARGITLPTFR